MAGDDSLAAVQTGIHKGRMWRAVRGEEDCRLVEDTHIGLLLSLSARCSDENSLDSCAQLHMFTHKHTLQCVSHSTAKPQVSSIAVSSLSYSLS